MVGLIIVVYAKKDQKTKVIIISPQELKSINNKVNQQVPSRTYKELNENKTNPLIRDLPESIENEWMN